MKDRITLHTVYTEERQDLPCAPFTFSGGEPHVQFNPDDIAGRRLWVDARVGTADGFMRAMAVLDAVRACNPARLGLFMPYFPGARQDRRQPGTPFTLKLYADMVRRAAPDLTVVLDPHSDVLAALVDVEVIPAHQVMYPFIEKFDGWICPDAGAEKRVYAAAKEMGQSVIIHARKKRDTKTGALSGFAVEAVPYGDYLVVDDICDGGGTFIGLADAVTTGAELSLWVTHGIFSKGVDELLKRYNKIYTTDSFPHSIEHPRVVVRDVHPDAAAIMRRRIGT